MQMVPEDRARMADDRVLRKTGALPIADRDHPRLARRAQVNLQIPSRPKGARHTIFC